MTVTYLSSLALLHVTASPLVVALGLKGLLGGIDLVLNQHTDSLPINADAKEKISFPAGPNAVPCAIRRHTVEPDFLAEPFDEPVVCIELLEQKKVDVPLKKASNIRPEIGIFSLKFAIAHC